MASAVLLLDLELHHCFYSLQLSSSWGVAEQRRQKQQSNLFLVPLLYRTGVSYLQCWSFGQTEEFVWKTKENNYRRLRNDDLKQNQSPVGTLGILTSTSCTGVMGLPDLASSYWFSQDSRIGWAAQSPCLKNDELTDWATLMKISINYNLCNGKLSFSNFFKNKLRFTCGLMWLAVTAP